MASKRYLLERVTKEPLVKQTLRTPRASLPLTSEEREKCTEDPLYFIKLVNKLYDVTAVVISEDAPCA